MRTIPLITRMALEAEASGDMIVAFLTLTHPEIDIIIRLAADGADWLYDGNLYTGGGFDVSLVSDDDQPAQARLRVPNIHPERMARLENVTQPALCRLDLFSSAGFFLAANPHTPRPGASPFYTAEGLELTAVTVTADAAEGTLRARDYRQEAWPGLRATRNILPGAWA